MMGFLRDVFTVTKEIEVYISQVNSIRREEKVGARLRTILVSNESKMNKFIAIEQSEPRMTKTLYLNIEDLIDFIAECQLKDEFKRKLIAKLL